MRVDELEQALGTYCWSLAAGDGEGVYTNPGDFLDELTDELLVEGSDEERAMALEIVRKAYPAISELDDLYRNDPERFRAACKRVGEDGAWESGVIERILNEATEPFRRLKMPRPLSSWNKCCVV